MITQYNPSQLGWESSRIYSWTSAADHEVDRKAVGCRNINYPPYLEIFRGMAVDWPATTI